MQKSTEMLNNKVSKLDIFSSNKACKWGYNRRTF